MNLPKQYSTRRPK